MSDKFPNDRRKVVYTVTSHSVWPGLPAVKRVVTEAEMIERVRVVAPWCRDGSEPIPTGHDPRRNYR